MSQTLITCEYCFREWDGYAQCPCWIELSDDEDYSNQKNKKIVVKKTPLELAQEAVDIKFNTRYKNK